MVDELADAVQEAWVVIEAVPERPELKHLLHASGVPPLRLMDRVGPDVVLVIEEHYAQVRPALTVGPRRLRREYIEQGRLGEKTGRGF